MSIWTMIGFTAATLTSGGFIPQTVKALKTKHTKDLSLPMLVLLNVGFVLWLVYGLSRKDTVLIFANIVSSVSGIILLAAKIKYG